MLQSVGQRRGAVLGDQLATAAKQVGRLGVVQLFDDQGTDEFFPLLRFSPVRWFFSSRRREQRQNGEQAGVRSIDVRLQMLVDFGRGFATVGGMPKWVFGARNRLGPPAQVAEFTRPSVERVEPA